MKRSITTWTTTLASAALLGLPVAALAKPQQPSSPPQQQQPAPQPTQPQQPQPAPQPTQPPTEPQPTQPQPTQPQPTPQPTDPQPTQPKPTPQPTDPQPTPQTPPPATTQQSSTTGAADQNVTPEEHLRQASAALTDIKTTSIPARSRAQFAELRRHINALENPASANAAGKSSTRGAAGAAKADNWGTEVAAIDRIITDLVGTDTATGASGTSTAGATGTAGRSRTATSATIDEATRAKLMDVRTHITAYAAAKSGASSTPRSDAGAATQNQASTEPSANAATSSLLA